MLPESVAVPNDPLDALKPQVTVVFGLVTVAVTVWVAPAVMLEVESIIVADGVGAGEPPPLLLPLQPTTHTADASTMPVNAARIARNDVKCITPSSLISSFL